MSGLVRTISHWTAGGGLANSIDIEHYAVLTQFDATVVFGNGEPEDNIVTSDGDYMAHTRNLNTGSIPLAMCGMKDAKEFPLDYGPAPINRKQFEQHCKQVALMHQKYGIPVTPTTCLTHAEVEPVLGVKQAGKWDLTVLPFEPSIRGAIPVGNYMRERVRSYMGITVPQETTYPKISFGSKGRLVKEAQDLLKMSGHFLGEVDGDFGRLTRTATIAFQAENGLFTDGVIGPVTWAALMTAKAAPERDVTAKDLRERGSQTIKAADDLTKVAGAGGVIAAGGTALETLNAASGSLSQAQSSLELLQGTLLTYWPLIAVGVAAFLVWRYADSIKKSRVADARSGRNLGR